MAEDTATPHRVRLPAVARWTGIALAGLAVILALLLVGLDTRPGRAFLTRQINAYETASGLGVRVGRIEGSIYGAMVLREVAVRDTRGVFLTAPVLRIDWRPFAYLHRKIDVRSFTAPLVTLQRLPALRPTPSNPNAPILPDIDLRLDRLAIDRLVVEPAVSGRRHLVAINGSADIANGRARIAARAEGDGGDRAMLKLDAVPADDRLAIDAQVEGPRGGLITGLLGTAGPVAANVAGRGSWGEWHGRARAALDGRPLLDLALTARRGSFTATGEARPAPLLPPAVARLAEPVLRLDLAAALDKRRADTRFHISSAAADLSGQGLLDLGRSRFGDFRITALLLQPGSIAPELTGRDVRLAATLDGPFAGPFIDYRLTAAAIGFGRTGVTGLAAAGRARIDADRILLPVDATARAVTGLDAAAGGTLANLRLKGDLAISGGRIVSDNLRLRSDRIDATAIVIADIPRGRYTGALKGRVNSYRIDGIGRFDLVADAKLVSGKAGGFGIQGRVRIDSRRIDNASVRGVLGGPARIFADVSMDPAGRIGVANLRLQSPQLRITGGGGTYLPDGRLRFTARGASTRYGPVAVEVTGTASQPDIHLRAARPNIGVPLSDVDARVRATGAGYAVTATGASPYGPLSADIMIATGAGRQAIDIRRLSFAGINAAGRIAQTPTGPFAGTLSFAGAGLDGTIRLDAAGRDQRADISARADHARIPTDPPVIITNGAIRASLVLTPGGPEISGSANLSGVRRGTLMLARAQAKLDYRGQKGTVQLAATGQAGAPFTIAAQAALSPGHILANLRGTANGVALRLARPARIDKEGGAQGAWRLQPATIILPQGEIDLSGSYGRETAVRAELRNVDLAIAESMAPGLGLGGRASGRIAATLPSGGGLPTIDARLTIARFTRSSAATISAPVDIAFAALLGPAEGHAAAVIRRGGDVIGRLKASLSPIPPGGDWSQRLAAAPLSGGIRYNGPSEVLWGLSGMAGQEVSGPIAVAADFGGRLGHPTLNGIVRARALRYANNAYGTVIRNIAIDGRFDQDRLTIASLSGNAGSGSVSGRGSIGLSAENKFPIDLSLTLDKARLAHSDALGATLSGTLHIVNGPATGPLIQGDLRLPEARYEIIRQGAADVTDLQGVRWKGGQPPNGTAQAAETRPSNWKLDIRLRAANQIFVSGMGLESEWRADMRVRGTATDPVLTGQMQVVRGAYSFAGKRFELSRGEIDFNGGTPIDPTIDIEASATVNDITATIDVTGRAHNPQIAFSSTPALPQDEILARLLFGNSITDLSATQAIQLAAALNQLRGSGGGLNPLGKLRSATGIDRLDILGADTATGRQTALAAGKYITKNVYVEIITDARGFTATQLEISLTKALSVLSQTSSFSGQGASVRYSKDY